MPPRFTCSPSLTPSLVPTISPTTFFSFFNATSFFKSFYFTPEVGSLYLSAANSPAEFNNSRSLWDIFRSQLYPLDTQRDFDFYQVEVRSAFLLDDNSAQVRASGARCSDSGVTNRLISSLKSKTSVTLSCAGSQWLVRDGYLCVNCSLYTYPCEDPPASELLAPLFLPECTNWFPKMKAAFSVKFFFNIITPASVPRFYFSFFNRSSTSIRIEIIVEAKQKGARVYCAALSPSIARDVIFFIKNGKFFTIPSESFSGIKLLTLDNLIPSTDYSIYCYGEDLYGRGTSLDQVLRSHLVSFTECCRVISFINAPSTVSGDPSDYQKRKPSEYQFKYTLEYSPTVPVIVSPILENELGEPLSKSNFQVLPESQVFANQGSVIGSFILFGKIVQTIRIRLNISDPWTTYQAPPIISTSVSPQPGKSSLIRAKLLDSGLGFMITLNGSLPGIFSATRRCDSLFQFPGANETECVFKTWNSVLVLFTRTYLYPGVIISQRFAK